jgi:hypothetical protein
VYYVCTQCVYAFTFSGVIYNAIHKLPWSGTNHHTGEVELFMSEMRAQYAGEGAIIAALNILACFFVILLADLVPKIGASPLSSPVAHCWEPLTVGRNLGGGGGVEMARAILGACSAVRALLWRSSSHVAGAGATVQRPQGSLLPLQALRTPPRNCATKKIYRGGTWCYVHCSQKDVNA